MTLTPFETVIIVLLLVNLCMSACLIYVIRGDQRREEYKEDVHMKFNDKHKDEILKDLRQEP